MKQLLWRSASLLLCGLLSACLGPGARVSTLVNGQQLIFAKSQDPADTALPRTGWEPWALSVDPEGMIWVADTPHHRILKITPTGIVSLAAGDDAPGNQDGQALDARLRNPQGLSWTPGGLLIADTGNQAIRRLSAGQLSTELVAYPLKRPVAVDADSQGILYVADAGSGQIIRKQSQRAPNLLMQLEPQRLLQNLKLLDDQLYYSDNQGFWKLEPALRRQLLKPEQSFSRLSGFAFWQEAWFLSDAYGKRLLRFGDQRLEALSLNRSESDKAILKYPGSLAVDPSSNTLIIADPGQDRLLRLSREADQWHLATLAQTGTQGFGVRAEGEDLGLPHGVLYDQQRQCVLVSDYFHQRLLQIDAQGKATPWPDSRINLPTGLAQATDGTIYVSGQHQIYAIDAQGKTKVVAGNGKSGLKDGPAIEAQLWIPWGLAAAPDGSLYIADHSNHAIRRLYQGQLTTLAGNGEAGLRNGKGSEARFHHPSGLLLLPDGNLLVTDSWNHQLRLVSPDGQVSSYAGTRLGLKEGARGEAEFYLPSGLARGARGEIYVADSWNHRIRRIQPNGQVETLAGQGRWLNWNGGTSDGDGSWARFNQPSALALDPQGRLLVADTGNHRVRVVETP